MECNRLYENIIIIIFTTTSEVRNAFDQQDMNINTNMRMELPWLRHFVGGTQDSAYTKSDVDL